MEYGERWNIWVEAENHGENGDAGNNMLSRGVAGVDEVVNGAE